MRRLLPLPLLAALLLPAAAQAKPQAVVPTKAMLGRSTLVRIRDRVLTGHRARALRPRLSGYGGTYTTPSGARVRVYTSNAFAPNPAVNQGWANFFDSLVHGKELNQLTVFILSTAEITKECGADADSCYSPDDNLMELLGDQTGSATQIPEIAAHEYGHHIAHHRNNAPWSADDWGPKYWASYEEVCPNVASGNFYPGNEDAHYDENPNEAWAETNRLLNGGKGPWDIVDRYFIPDADAYRYARQDILRPWTHRTVRTFRGRFSPNGRQKVIPLNTFADGDLRLDLNVRDGLDADLELYDHRTHRRLKRAATDGADTIRTQVCGQAGMDVKVLRYRRGGRWTLTVKQP